MQRSPLFSNLSTDRIQLVVAYDGTDFSGWAAQPDRRTVHRTLTEAVRQVCGEECEIIGASRTDSGAHARHQVAHFDCGVNIPVENWKRALNAWLPLDVSIRSVRRVRPDFHSRFSAIDRLYRYRIRCGDRTPFASRYAFDTHHRLDLDKMRKAAKPLVGSRNFWALSEEVPRDANPIREVFDLQVRQSGPEIWIDVRGNAFMRGMMRRIAGGLFEVGRGRRRPESLDEILTLGTNVVESDRPVVLPARGLCLMKIRYGRHPKDFREQPVEQDFD